MNKYKQKISRIIKMFEIIYSNRDKYNVGIIRLWSLKKMRDKARDYIPLFDMTSDNVYVTKKVTRDIDYIYDVFTAIINSETVDE